MKLNTMNEDELRAVASAPTTNAVFKQSLSEWTNLVGKANWIMQIATVHALAQYVENPTAPSKGLESLNKVANTIASNASKMGLKKWSEFVGGVANLSVSTGPDGLEKVEAKVVDGDKTPRLMEGFKSPYALPLWAEFGREETPEVKPYGLDDLLKELGKVMEGNKGKTREVTPDARRAAADMLKLGMDITIEGAIAAKNGGVGQEAAIH